MGISVIFPIQSDRICGYHGKDISSLLYAFCAYLYTKFTFPAVDGETIESSFPNIPAIFL